MDQSGLANTGRLKNGTVPIDGKCGKGLNFTENSYIALNGDEFRQKPSNAISLSVWIHLNTNRLVNLLLSFHPKNWITIIVPHFVPR